MKQHFSRSSLLTGIILMMAALAVPAQKARAEDKLLHWMDNSLTVLTGTNFTVPGDNISTLTFEHASGWSWGDLFTFFDYLDYHSNPAQSHSWYGEFSPRISLGKVAGLKFSENSIIQDVLISTTWERGKNGTEGLLLGAAVDLKVPGFQFFKLNAYARKDTGQGAGFEDMQWTLAWSRPFKVGDEGFRIDGFIDYVVGWGPQASPTIHIVPQIKWDLGAKWGKPGKIWFGTEIDIWKNQFGIKDSPAFDTDQFAINAILKVHF